MGVKSENNDFESWNIKNIQKGEILLVSIGSTSSGGKVISSNIKNNAKISLLKPVCSSLEEKVALSRKINNNWRLIGWGNIKNGRIIYSNSN